MENTTANAPKSFFDSLLGAQKQIMDQWTATAENFTKNIMDNQSNPATDSLKNWYDSQMAFFYDNNNNGNNGSADKFTEFYNNWFKTQMDWSAKSTEQFQNMFKNMQFNTPFANMNNGSNNFFGNMSPLFSNWTSTMQNMYQEMSKNMKNDNLKDSLMGMFHTSENYMRFFELWMPFFKNIQNKTFTMDMFKQAFDQAKYKDMMDKIFGFTPDFMKNFYSQGNNAFVENMAKVAEAGRTNYDNFKTAMNSFAPQNGNVFNFAATEYHKFSSNIENMFAPLSKVMTPGTQKDQMHAIAEIVEKYNLYQIRNAQMQYMSYITGIKAMESFALNIANKVENKEEISSFMNLYNDWLTTIDQAYVEYYSSDEYCQLQAELNTLTMVLKKGIEKQYEKLFVNFPMVTRSEMDELYQTIYELKKKVRTMEREQEANASANTTSHANTTAETVVNEESKNSKKASKNA